MKYSKFIALAAFALPMVAFAQTEVTFENQDYKSLSLPVRKGDPSQVS